MTIAALTDEARRPLVEREPGSDDDDETPAIDLKALRREEERRDRLAKQDAKDMELRP